MCINNKQILYNYGIYKKHLSEALPMSINNKEIIYNNGIYKKHLSKALPVSSNNKQILYNNVIYKKRLSEALPICINNKQILYKIRDYLTLFGLLHKVSTGDPIISGRALARGLIMVEGWY